ncbi:MAG TPA: lamin tail domain-containing protein [Chitinophagales bacterium]|nr:lamin tail domain-containing protein [Chitinophagales bacterium]
MKKFYLLFSMAVLVTASVFAQPCNKLFFSEYVEGASNNKALEIYNPTSAPVSLFGYRIALFPNGATAPNATFNLNAVIAAGDVYVIVNNQADSATFKTKADTVSGVTNFNGDDVIMLLYGTDTIDKFGVYGVDPGTAWQVDTVLDATANHTLIRKSNVQQGVSTWNPSEWLVLSQDSNKLGLHTGPTGLTPCSVTPQDTLANFAPTSGTFTGITGNFNLTVQLSLPHTDSLHVDVALVTGNAAFLNNYTTQTVGFGSGVTQRNLALTITNTDSATHTFTFKLVNPSNGLLVGGDSVFTLTVEAPAVQPTDSCATLFFSEYVEGTASNKALEIYNPTAAAVDLKFYQIQVYSNGGTAPSSTFNLSGSIAAGDVYVIVYTNADTLKPYADTITSNGVVNFSGNDAVVLLHGPDTLDIIGVIGDTVSNWTVAGGNTQNHTLVRGSNVKKGNNDWTVASGQWVSLPVDSVQLGSHTGPVNQTACTLTFISGVTETVNNIGRIYPNPNNGNFTIELENNRGPVDVRLFDLSGRMVHFNKENATLININLNQLNAGMYVVEVKEGNNISRSKITVQQ